MAILTDPEFGAITIRRTRLARQVSLRLDERGVISVSMPLRTPQYIAKRLIEESRANLRGMLQRLEQKRARYESGDTIGKSHRLYIQYGDHLEPKHKLRDQALVVSLPHHTTELQAQRAIRAGIAEALRVQARSYLPQRLRRLAVQYGLTYDKLRFSSAGTRWGSCSSSGTISLNIWLMEQPFELIDYVIIHELCHTRELNHSPAFWSLVANCCPEYKAFRKALKTRRPYA